MPAAHANMVWFSLVADALALGPHWVYEPQEIATRLGRVSSYAAPLTDYHPSKMAGDFTHYGDQTMLLLKTIAQTGTFDLAKFAQRWQAFWERPNQQAYRDRATRQTLEILRDGAESARKGSDSTEIGGAARIAPLFLLSWPDAEALVDAARAETALTHPEAVVVAAAEFFCRVALAVSTGSPIDRALRESLETIGGQDLPEPWLRDAEQSAASGVSDLAALESFGLSCATSAAFPGICHLLLRYPNDPQTALIENASAGGDNAARGMILGLVYGATFARSALPDAWMVELRARNEIQQAIDKLGES